VWTNLVLNFGLSGSRDSIFGEVETSLRLALGPTQCNLKVKFRYNLLSCHASSQRCGGGHNASLYRVGHEKVARVPFFTCPCDILSGVSMYIA